MTIQKFVKQQYRKIDAYAGVQQLKQDLSQGEVFVVQERDAIIGLLTSHDVAVKPHRLVIDCLVKKPVVYLHQTVEEVFAIMQQYHTHALLVYQQDTCIGVIYEKDISAHFRNALTEQAEITKTIVHDIRNYISNISSITEIVTKQIRKKETSELLSYAATACNSSLELLQELQFLDQLEHYDGARETHPVNINVLLQQCVQTVMAAAAQKELTIHYQPSKTEWLIMADNTSLKRAFLNILNNAVKFTHLKGRVTVSVTARKNHNISIAIKDTGIGIPEEMTTRIFDKFTRAKRRGTQGEESTGLGMFITKQIVEMYGGTISVESEVQKGTTFYVTFPLPAEQLVS